MARPKPTDAERREWLRWVKPIFDELARQERTQAWLARKMGVTPGVVTYWRYAQRRPSARLLAKAREVLNMPPEPRLTKARDSPPGASAGDSGPIQQLSASGPDG